MKDTTLWDLWNESNLDNSLSSPKTEEEPEDTRRTIVCNLMIIWEIWVIERSTGDLDESLGIFPLKGYES